MEYSSYEKAAFTITGPLNIQLLTNIYDLKFLNNETTAL